MDRAEIISQIERCPDDIVGIVLPQLKEIIDFEVRQREYLRSHPLPVPPRTATGRGVIVSTSERPPLVIGDE